MADDHALVREGMAEMLATDGGIEVVAQAADGREAVYFAERARPDVVVLDVEMPVMGGQVALKKMLALSPPPKVVIVTVLADEARVRELLALGANAFLSKNASMQTLIDAVRSVAAGDGAEDNVVLSVPRGALGSGGRGEPGEGALSATEAEVLLRAARGEGNREIAEGLHLSETTVKRRLSGVYEKLGVGSRGEATRKAMSEGWISGHDLYRED